MKIRFLKEVPVGHKVYRPGDEAEADLNGTGLWVRSSGHRTGRRLEVGEYDLLPDQALLDQTDFDKLLEGGKG